MKKRTTMLEGQNRFTFTRMDSKKWQIHTDGVRKAGRAIDEISKTITDFLPARKLWQTALIEVSHRAPYSSASDE